MTGTAETSDRQVKDWIIPQVAKSAPRTVKVETRVRTPVGTTKRERVAIGPPRRWLYLMLYPTLCSKETSVSLLQEIKTPRQGRGSLY
jgi:hypothetical protein